MVTTRCRSAEQGRAKASPALSFSLRSGGGSGGDAVEGEIGALGTSTGWRLQEADDGFFWCGSERPLRCGETARVFASG